MNVIQALFCNQHFELKPKGKAESARINGIGLVTISLVLNILTIGFLVVILVPSLSHDLNRVLKSIIGQSSGKTAGKFIAGVPFLIIYPLVRYVIGTQARYDKIIANFEQLPEKEQERVSNLGLYYFILSLVTSVIAIGWLLLFNL